MVIPCQGRSDSKKILDKFQDESIDYIMIDGAHEHDAVLDDIENWWPKLKPEGVMFGDDFKLESVSEAVRKMMVKFNTHGFSVNGSTEQTWFTSKKEDYKRFEKVCPGINSLK
jgi:predicted O-methyltransferase YrrM